MKQDWRCDKCGTLLGIEREPRMHVRYKQLEMMVEGSDYRVTLVCRNCFALNEYRNQCVSQQSMVVM